jgi:hypothetical protein
MVREHCYRASLPSKYNFSFPFVILQEGFFYDCDVIGCYLQAYVGEMYTVYVLIEIKSDRMLQSKKKKS